ncbi:hypothetical protein RR46_03483 [Papilio xuthus]|uniref:Uncharacterized protein n=1 Tax=Papilio xuthus TaxID=66420 RepID=A0A194Q9M3_PAPXU|nr:hypothetical protein RR46_03483 [Papilio xuthus]
MPTIGLGIACRCATLHCARNQENSGVSHLANEQLTSYSRARAKRLLLENSVEFASGEQSVQSCRGDRY